MAIMPRLTYGTKAWLLAFVFISVLVEFQCILYRLPVIQIQPSAFRGYTASQGVLFREYFFFLLQLTL